MRPSGVRRIVVDGVGRLPQFAHAAVAGDTVYVSGTLGTTEGLELAHGVGSQTTQALENMGRILAASGATWDDVAKVSVFLRDMGDFAAMNEAYGSFFTGIPPARITVGGCDLALGALVEMECTAAAPASVDDAARTLPRRREFTVERDGEVLHVETVGEGGVPLVLCHGAGGSHAVWFQQVMHFAVDRMVVTWDHRGFGRSTDRADRSGPEVAAGDLLAICDHLGIDEADLVGQSMGGWSVVGAVLERPELARSVVLADTLGGFRSDAVDAALAAPRSVEPSPPDGGVAGLHPALDPSLARRHPERALLYQQLGGFGTADPATVIGRLLATTHDADDAARITCPVLCVVGARDPLFPPDAVRAVADLLPHATIVEIPGSGHSPYFEDPEHWNLVVRHFLDRVTTRS